MKNIIYTFLILFIGYNVSAQEKESEQELNTYLEKSTTKTYVEKEFLYYKTSTEYALGYEGLKTKESPIIEYNLNKLIVYRKNIM